MQDTKNWMSLVGLVEEIKKCDQAGLIYASLALCYIFIDTCASLARPDNKTEVTRSDFINWIDRYLVGHDDQPYKYRGKDVYAARCAYLHSYGSMSASHSKDTDIKIFGYHNGGKHNYDESINSRLVIIGVKSLINDVIIAGEKFLGDCKSESSLCARVEKRLPMLLFTFHI